MKRKLLLLIGIMAFIIPFNAHAEYEAEVIVDCPIKTLNPGQNAGCNLSINASDITIGFNIVINSTSNLEISDLEVSNKQFMCLTEENSLACSTEHDLKGEISIGSFSVKAKPDAKSGTGIVTLTDLNVSPENGKKNPLDDIKINFAIAGTDSSLSKLTIDNKTIDGFSSSKFSYELVVDHSKSSIKIGATATDTTITPTGLGTKKLGYGYNHFDVKVKSATSESIYTIDVYREDPRLLKTFEVITYDKDAKSLGEVDLNEYFDKFLEVKQGAYSKEGIEYINFKKNGNYLEELVICVDYDVESIEIIGLVEDSAAASFVEKYGPRKIEKLAIGNNDAQIKIVDANGEELVYPLVINRLNKDGKDVTKTDKNTNTTKNPQTFGGTNIGIAMIVIILFGGIYFAIRKRSKFPNKA